MKQSFDEERVATRVSIHPRVHLENQAAGLTDSHAALCPNCTGHVSLGGPTSILHHRLSSSNLRTGVVGGPILHRLLAVPAPEMSTTPAIFGFARDPLHGGKARSVSNRSVPALRR